MGFNKLRMGQEEIFTTVVEDMDGRKLEEWKVMKKDFPRVVKVLNNKFGLGMRIIEKDERDRDLDWTK